MTRAWGWAACLVQARPGGVPGGSKGRGLMQGLGSCWCLWVGGCENEGAGGGRWESHPHYFLV